MVTQAIDSYRLFARIYHSCVPIIKHDDDDDDVNDDNTAISNWP